MRALRSVLPRIGLLSGSGMDGYRHAVRYKLTQEDKVQPRFPKFAQGKNVLGRVVLQAVVRSDGTVGNIEVLKEAGGDRGFEAAAIEAVLP